METEMETDPGRTEPVLSGKVAIVTGAAQGIGAEYALMLAAHGAAVLVADVLDGGDVVARIRAAGGRAQYQHTDVTDAASVEAMAQAALQSFGRIDILVNNAALFGRLTPKPFEQIDSREWDHLMAVNVRGAFECAKAVLPAMRRQRYGKIVNIASGTAFKGTPMLLHYVTSKGAILSLTRALAREVGVHGIRVNTLAPGLTRSANVIDNPAWQGKVSENNVASRAIQRDALPQDLTGTLLYLVSPASDFVTGQALVVDGGSVMH